MGPEPQKEIPARLKIFFVARRLEAAVVLVLFLLLVVTGLCFILFSSLAKNKIKSPLSPDQPGASESALILGIKEEAEAAAPPETAPAPALAPKPEPTPAPPPKTTPPPAPRAGFFPGRGTPNNKFGMYVNTDSSQIADAASLINSNGGDWGWVLIPMDVRQRNAGLWQGIFDAAKAHHIKPLIQLFNNNTCDVNEMDFPGLADFFNELAWPTKHLYISVFNETNAKDYWCEKLAPEEYAVALSTAIDTFKSVNPNFFLMPAGLNSSCRNGPRYMDEEDYLLAMGRAVPGIFGKLDGWATHAYPQPEFSGDFYNPPSWYGVRDQIENYKWELSLLKKHFGVTGLPVFITETGWAHKEGEKPKREYKPAAVTARYFDDAYRSHWLPDDRVAAIMPFVWRKEDAPNFNWVRPDGSYYPQYDIVKDIPKVAGTND